MLVALLACAGCSSERRDHGDLSAVIPFDDRRVVFYWEGVRIHSPARLAMDEDRLVINGVRWKEPPAVLDKVEANANLAKHFRGVPFVDSLVSSGNSWLEAVNAHGLEMPRRFRRAFFQLRSDLRARGESVTIRSAPALAALLDVPIDAIRIDEHTASCRFPGGLSWHELIEAPDSVLARDPFYRPPLPPNYRQEHFRAMTTHFRRQLWPREPTLLVQQRYGSIGVAMRGPAALEARAALEVAVRRPQVDVEELVRTTGISRDLLTTIVERRSESPAPH